MRQIVNEIICHTMKNNNEKSIRFHHNISTLLSLSELICNSSIQMVQKNPCTKHEVSEV